MVMAGRTRTARERVAAARAEQTRRKWRTKIAIFGVGGVAAAALVATSTWGIVHAQADKGRPAMGVSGSGTGQPPWPLPADPVKGARAMGLQVQPMEGTAVHFHTHLDVIVNGRPVPVPANLGIEPDGSEMSELHTHDATGLLHIEAPSTGKRYSLGQVFGEWDVHLDAKDIGGLKAGGNNVLRAYVGGKPVTGNPADIELTPHREIALVYGPAGQKVNVPTAYDFPPES
jgi:hypothetical protein